MSYNVFAQVRKGSYVLMNFKFYFICPKVIIKTLKMALNPDQHCVYQMAVTFGHNTLVLGKVGAGKMFLLRYIQLSLFSNSLHL